MPQSFRLPTPSAGFRLRSHVPEAPDSVTFVGHPSRVAWSHNLGHEGVLTTFTSYGAVGNHRQREIIGSIGTRPHSQLPTADEMAKAVALLKRYRTH